MLLDQFKDLYTTNRLNQKSFQQIIDRVLFKVDYSDKNRYKRDKNKNGRIGVFNKFHDDWSWSWINTINTNYTCLYLIIDFLNEKYHKKITKDWFVKNPDECFTYLEEKIYDNKEIIFKPGSKIFKKMFFATQKIWNDGLISSISSFITIAKYYNIKCDITYHRGEENDMMKGTDLLIDMDGKSFRCQHKLCDLVLRDDYYVSKRFIYNEQTYRNNLDLISVENDNKIYLFNNSTIKELCFTDDNYGFTIHKNLLVKVMEKENTDIMNLLREINVICGRKNVIFSIEKNETENNYFEEVVVGNQNSLRFFFNNFNDRNLQNILIDQLNKLK